MYFIHCPPEHVVFCIVSVSETPQGFSLPESNHDCNDILQCGHAQTKAERREYTLEIAKVGGVSALKDSC